MTSSILHNLYSTPGSATFLASPELVFKRAKELDQSITLNQVREFIKKKISYQLTNESGRSQRGHPKFITTHPYQEVHCDIGFWNKNAFKYLICRDLFTGTTHSKFLGNKKDAKRTLNAFKKIEEEAKFPIISVAFDRGTEFMEVIKYMRNKGSKAKQLQSYQHAFAAEKAISDIRKLFRKYKIESGKKDIRKIMQKLVSSINKRTNRVTGMSSLDAQLVENFGKVFERRYKKYLQKIESIDTIEKFQPGQRVRISSLGSASSKSSFKKPETKFSSTIFTVYKRVPNSFPPSYILQDENGTFIDKPFYQRHLYPV